jgi:hypothetical protein
MKRRHRLSQVAMASKKRIDGATVPTGSDAVRYQIFVSSTFRDLVEERRLLLQALLELRHIPVGMELFPAADESFWPLIASLIDSSDYFVLVIGGRYGTRDSRGLGFTEREYRLAVELGKPIVALLHQDPDELPSTKTDGDADAWRQLQRFRAQVEQGHRCGFWKTPQELSQAFLKCFAATARRQPAPGWTRPRGDARRRSPPQARHAGR